MTEGYDPGMDQHHDGTRLRSAVRPTWVRTVIWITIAFLIGSIVLGMMLY